MVVQDRYCSSVFRIAARQASLPLSIVLCRIAAILERRAFLYNLETLELLGTLDTPPNPKVGDLLGRSSPGPVFRACGIHAVAGLALAARSIDQ